MKLRGTMEIERGELIIGGISASELVASFGTPLYVLDEELLRTNCRRFYRSFKVEEKGNEVVYASKALLNRTVAHIIKEEGLGLDIVSGGEMFVALKAGFPPQKIYFHGNNKSAEELRLALQNKIGFIVVDNFDELELLDTIAKELGLKADILLRLTPGIEAHTHSYIQTGQIDSKFGFTVPTGQAEEAVREALNRDNLNLCGVHCHIGSQIFELEAFGSEVKIMLDFMVGIKEKFGFTLSILNLGGGFGIYYTEEDQPAEIEEYTKVILETAEKEAALRSFPLPRLVIEPGRSIAGPAGTTLYSVGTIKEVKGVRKFVAVDGGMSDNIRPALYQAKYEAAVANKMEQEEQEEVTIVGKCCESGDILIRDIKLPPLEKGDILAVAATGAYCYPMASNYNRLGRPPMVLVGGGRADLISRRESYEDMLLLDTLPGRFKEKEN